jgi:hypothetical protein
VSTTRHFAAELIKLAFLGNKVPIIPSSMYSHSTQTGSGVQAHAQRPLATFRPPKPLKASSKRGRLGSTKPPSVPAAKRTANPVQKIMTTPRIQSGAGDSASSGANASGLIR